MTYFVRMPGFCCFFFVCVVFFFFIPLGLKCVEFLYMCEVVIRLFFLLINLTN